MQWLLGTICTLYVTKFGIPRRRQIPFFVAAWKASHPNTMHAGASKIGNQTEHQSLLPLNRCAVLYEVRPANS